MRNSYIEETFVAEKLRQLYPTAKVLERGKSNAFSEDILVQYSDGASEKFEVKQMSFRSSEQSLIYLNGKYKPFDGSIPGKYTQNILNYLENNNIIVEDKGIQIPVDIKTAKGYLREQLLRRGNDKVVFSDYRSNLFKIFDLRHDLDIHIADCAFTLRKKPSGTKTVIPETLSAFEACSLISSLFPVADIVNIDNRVFVKLPEIASTKIELSED